MKLEDLIGRPRAALVNPGHTAIRKKRGKPVLRWNWQWNLWIWQKAEKP